MRRTRKVIQLIFDVSYRDRRLYTVLWYGGVDLTLTFKLRLNLVECTVDTRKCERSASSINMPDSQLPPSALISLRTQRPPAVEHLPCTSVVPPTGLLSTFINCHVKQYTTEIHFFRSIKLLSMLPLLLRLQQQFKNKGSHLQS